MSVPRFLFLATRRADERRDARACSDFLWRLVAGNNRLLGRSPGTYDREDLCREAVSRLVTDLAQAAPGQAPLSRPGNWSWQLALRFVDHPPLVLAVSARSYERQRESRFSLENFLAAVPIAAVAATVAVRPRTRQLLRTDLTLPPVVIQGQELARDGGRAIRPRNTRQLRTGWTVGAGSSPGWPTD